MNIIPLIEVHHPFDIIYEVVNTTFDYTFQILFKSLTRNFD